jgi:hypothetical protein
VRGPSGGSLEVFHRGKITLRLQKKASAGRVEKCEKTREFLVILDKIVSISALFRSFSRVFTHFNRWVVSCGGAARSFPTLARTEGRRQKIILLQGERRNGAEPRARFVSRETKQEHPRRGNGGFPAPFSLSLFCLPESGAGRPSQVLTYEGWYKIALARAHGRADAKPASSQSLSKA